MQSGGASFWHCGGFIGVGSRWFIQQGGTSLCKLAFFRQGRGLVVSSLRVTRIVERIRAVVVGFWFSFPCRVNSWVFAQSTRQPSSHCSHTRRTSLEDRCASEHWTSDQARVSLREVTPDRAATGQGFLGTFWDVPSELEKICSSPSP